MFTKKSSAKAILILCGLAAFAIDTSYATGQLGVNINLAEQGGTFVDMVKENYRWSTPTGTDLTSAQVDPNGWPKVDAQFLMDFRDGNFRSEQRILAVKLHQHTPHGVNFSALRFMDFLASNDREPVYPAVLEWAQRKTRQDASQAPLPVLSRNEGGAWEYVVQIANESKRDAWNLPGGFLIYEGGPSEAIGDTTNVAHRIMAERDSGMGELMKYNYGTATCWVN